MEFKKEELEFYNRFKKYISIDTTSEIEYKDKPSNDNEFVLANILKKELVELGLINLNINKFATVYGYLKGNDDSNKDSICLIAHLDTSNQAKGNNINSKLVKYKNKDIKLSNDIYLSSKDYEVLNNKLDHTLIVTDGTTLLGGDDKAGITIIMELLTYLVNNKEVKHCPIEVVFTSDEEIGIGADHIDLNLIKSKYAYTIDGGDLHYIDNENFNAATLNVHIKGRSIHPGYAKDKLINAINIGILFDESLPRYLRPQHTNDKIGFYHLSNIKGSEEECILNYIVREHDLNKLNYMLDIAKLTADRINELYNQKLINLEIINSYKNMKPLLDKNPSVIKRITDAYDKLNIKYEFNAIRGGTDGASLSYKGLICPNIATGGYNFHSRFEFVDLDESLQVIEILKQMVIS